MFLTRSLVHISYMYMIFCFILVHLGASPPPMPKAGYATVASFRSPEEWPNENSRFRSPPPPPPHALHEIAATDAVVSNNAQNCQ